MKRIAFILLALALSFSCLCSCEDDKAEKTAEETDPTASVTDGDETGLLPEVPF
ncbi:MAG: hypothetical protein IJX47_09020 [Clostridia bacterium]|nr:hypothetical protein [Clostridia bacterium]